VRLFSIKIYAVGLTTRSTLFEIDSRRTLYYLLRTMRNNHYFNIGLDPPRKIFTFWWPGPTPRTERLRWLSGMDWMSFVNFGCKINRLLSFYNHCRSISRQKTQLRRFDTWPVGLFGNGADNVYCSPLYD